MRFRLVVFVAILTLCTGFVFAQDHHHPQKWEWVSLDGSTKPAPVKVELLENTKNSVKFQITVAGYFKTVKKIKDTEVTLLHIPRCARTLANAGYPVVPKFCSLLKIDDYSDPQLVVVEKEVVEKDLDAPIIPARGHFNRNIPFDSVPFEFGPIYEEDKYWPAEEDQFLIGKAFLLRDVRGVRFRMLPISANHVQKKLRIIQKAVIEIKCEESRSLRNVITRTIPVPGKTFKKMYNNSFMNYTEPLRSTRSGVPNENSKKLVVVVPSKFKSAIANWVIWKKQCGYTVTEKEISSGTSANTIKSYLQGLYDSTSTRFSFVVLIGDSDTIPTFKGSKEGADADRVYVRLAGNDNYPDAFISRISARSVDAVNKQLAKLVAYEKGANGSWLKKGLGIASNQGSPADKERVEWLQNGGGSTQKVPIVSGGLLGAGYTSFTDVYDPYGTDSQVASAVNDGVGIITYVGHGSSTSWVSSGFNVSDIHNLNNGIKTPVIWSVACVNGNFVSYDECFAEAWLRKIGGGAVAMEAASTNESWVPPCDKQAATINAIIQKTYNTFGALEAAGVIAALQNWGDSNSTEGNKLAEQCNLFGDCTLKVRTAVSKDVTVNVTKGYGDVIIKVTDADNNVIENAVVTVHTRDMSFVVTGETNDNGNVTLSLQNAPVEELLYTVSGQDLNAQVEKTLE